MTLIPAYGRDYKSAKDVKADFNAEKDFMTSDIFTGYGQLINKQQIATGTSVVIRYKRNTQVTVIKVTR